MARDGASLLRGLGPIALGAAAVGAAMLAGHADVPAVLLAPPVPVRALLTIAAFLVGIALVLRASDRLRGSAEAADLVRGVRIVFLAVAAFAAAAGWLIGSPVPIVAALIIAGVDVIETGFLLLVTAARGQGRS
jgi:hypothetical protein